MGISFRATSGFVTDASGDTYSLGEAYPVTRGGYTFGFGTNRTGSSRDRASTAERLAGIVFVANGGSTDYFRHDVPAPGTYTLRLALGDADNAQTQRAVVRDGVGGTVLATITGATNPAEWRDAAGTVRTPFSVWNSSNTSISVTLTGTALVVELGDPGGSTATTISYIDVVGSGDTTAPTLTGSISIGTVTNSSIQISWPAGSDNVAVTSYEVSSNGGSSYTNVGNVLTYTFTGLAASTLYSLRVRAKDAAANVSSPALSATQSTTGSGDTTAPTLTGAISIGTVTSSLIQMSWPAGSDNVAVTSYEVSSNGGASYIDVGNVLTYTFTGLSASTTYGLRVRAKDAAGNVSSALSTSQATSAGGGGAATINLEGFKTWTGVPYASTSVNFVKVCRVSTGATVLELTNQSINASGNMTISSASLAAAVDYMVFGFNADGSLSFKKKVTAA